MIPCHVPVVEVYVTETIDAAGIGLLLDVHRDLWRAGARLMLRAPTPRLRRILRIARVDQVLSIVPDEWSVT